MFQCSLLKQNCETTERSIPLQADMSPVNTGNLVLHWILHKHQLACVRTTPNWWQKKKGWKKGSAAYFSVAKFWGLFHLVERHKEQIKIWNKTSFWMSKPSHSQRVTTYMTFIIVCPERKVPTGFSSCAHLSFIISFHARDNEHPTQTPSPRSYMTRRWNINLRQMCVCTVTERW